MWEAGAALCERRLCDKKEKVRARREARGVQKGRSGEGGGGGETGRVVTAACVPLELKLTGKHFSTEQLR